MSLRDKWTYFKSEWMRFWRHVGLAHRQPDKHRLETDIESLQAWVNRHKPAKAPCSEPGLPPRPWYSVCDEVLKQALEKAKKSDVSGGYEDLHIAEREAVPGMSQHEIDLRAKALRIEVSGKLKASWRGKVIMDLLGDEKPGSVSAEALADALNHRNTFDRNMHRKMDKVRWQLAWLGLGIFLLVLVAVLGSFWVKDLPPEGLSLLPFGIYLGLLGGMMSSAMSARGIDRNASVPEIGVEFYARIARALLGAAASVPVFIAGEEGIVSIGGSEHTKAWGLLLLCFISGFSERWFRNTVAAVAGGEDKGASGSSEGKK
jgi:hypothetical protein